MTTTVALVWIAFGAGLTVGGIAGYALLKDTMRAEWAVRLRAARRQTGEVTLYADLLRDENGRLHGRLRGLEEPPVIPVPEWTPMLHADELRGQVREMGVWGDDSRGMVA